MAMFHCRYETGSPLALDHFAVSASLPDDEEFLENPIGHGGRDRRKTDRAESTSIGQGIIGDQEHVAFAIPPRPRGQLSELPTGAILREEPIQRAGLRGPALLLLLRIFAATAPGIERWQKHELSPPKSLGVI